MNADFEILVIGILQRDRLLAMYDGFDPLGAALGLPPSARGARHMWIASALGHRVNVAAFSPSGDVLGHCFLAADGPGSAEITVFVRQEFRRRGIGAALLTKVLERGWAADLERVWAVTASGNTAALGLLKCGFQLIQSDSDVAELEVDLRVPSDAGEMLRQRPDLVTEPDESIFGRENL